MRKSTMRLVVPVISIPLFFVAACGGGESESESKVESLPSVSDVKVEGKLGEEPTITFTGDTAPTVLQRTILEEGDGDIVASGDILVADYLGQVWNGEVFESSFGNPGPAGFTIGADAVIPGWDEALVGLTEGSRVLLAVPPEDAYGAEGQPEVGIEADDVLVFVVDIVGSYGSDVTLDKDLEVLPGAPGVLVEGLLGERPKITIEEGTPMPAEEVVTILAEGEGEPVKDGSVLINYDVVEWANQPVESSWVTGAPIVVPITTDAGGAFDGLAGVPIGSRVLIQVSTVDPATGATAFAVVVDVLAQPAR